MSSDFVCAEDGAQVAIVNTCSVTKSAISKNKRIINKAKKENPKAKIILTGCWPKVYDVRAEELGVDFIFRVGEEDALVKEIFNFQFFPPQRDPAKAVAISKQLSSNNFQLKSNCDVARTNNDKSRYFIKIQDGCEQYCSYCVIPYARGKLKSRPEKEVIDEIKSAVDGGFREVVLSGIHIGLYGKDMDKNQKSKIKMTM